MVVLTGVALVEGVCVTLRIAERDDHRRRNSTSL